MQKKYKDAFALFSVLRFRAMRFKKQSKVKTTNEDLWKYLSEELSYGSVGELQREVEETRKRIKDFILNRLPEISIDRRLQVVDSSAGEQRATDRDVTLDAGRVDPEELNVQYPSDSGRQTSCVIEETQDDPGPTGPAVREKEAGAGGSSVLAEESTKEGKFILDVKRAGFTVKDITGDMMAEASGEIGEPYDGRSKPGYSVWMLAVLRDIFPDLLDNKAIKEDKVIEIYAAVEQRLREYLYKMTRNPRLFSVDTAETKFFGKVPIVNNDPVAFLRKFSDAEESAKPGLIIAGDSVESGSNQKGAISEWEAIIAALKANGRALIRPFKQKEVYGGSLEAIGRFKDFLAERKVDIDSIYVLPETAGENRLVFSLVKRSQRKGEKHPPDISGTERSISDTGDVLTEEVELIWICDGNDEKEMKEVLFHKEEEKRTPRKLFRGRLEEALKSPANKSLDITDVGSLLNAYPGLIGVHLSELSKATLPGSGPHTEPQTEMCLEASYNLGIVLTNLFPGHRIHLIDGKVDYKGISRNHVWIMVDDTIIIDMTYGQFDHRYSGKVLVASKTDLDKYGFSEWSRVARFISRRDVPTGSGSEGQPKEQMPEQTGTPTSPFFRRRQVSRLRIPDNLGQALMEIFVGYAHSGKLVIAVDKSFEKRGIDPREVALEIQRLKNDIIRSYTPGSARDLMERRLKDIVFLDFSSPQDLEESVRKEIGESGSRNVNARVFAFSPDIDNIFKDIERARTDIRPVIISEEETFSDIFHYPLVEIITLTLLREIWGESIKQFLKGLNMGGISLDALGIRILDADQSFMTVYNIVPRIKRHSIGNYTDYYAALLRFSRSA